VEEAESGSAIGVHPPIFDARDRRDKRISVVAMRLSTVILPIYRRAEADGIWRRADELGFHAGYTYDHLSWQEFRDRPWFGAVPTLAGAALATRRLRIGTLVTSPNFRHPVTLAKDVMTLDDLCGGRLIVGIGSGGTGFDASVLGQKPWSAYERTERFGEFLRLLDKLLTQPSTTDAGTHYSAMEARMIPGCVQQPRPPFLVAAAGRRGFNLAAELGQGWVTYGDPGRPAAAPEQQALAVVRTQLEGLEQACATQGRDHGLIDKVLLAGLTAEQPLVSVDAFVDWAGRYGELGFSELVLHWPVPDSRFATAPDVFEQVATDGATQLR
jgi:alkanesulfonate monooxygenase SsuD/methylene tetrahydromethanopterin reductase-like flavin-dependent oxidoreductase (luciferase family)